MLGHPAARLAYARMLAEDGEHQRAFPQFARAARRGLPAAQFRLGRCYLLGLGTPSSPDTALRWLTCSGDGGDVEAQALLASLALQGISVGAAGGLLEAVPRFAGRPPDYPAAMKWGRRAAAAGSAEAQTMLGYILTYGPDELRDVPRAARYYREAAESGFARGQLGWALALLGDNGAQDVPSRDGASQDGAAQDGTSRDAVSLGDVARDRSSEVRRLLEAAAQADLPAAHFVLGVLDELAGGGTERLATAAAHYHEAADRGHRAAQFRYGVALMTGRGVEQNTLYGESWLRRAGLAGDRDAAAMVGDLYSHPGEAPPNFCEAAMWFQRAADAGHIGAARALGQLCVRGGGFGTDPVAAAQWLRVWRQARAIRWPPAMSWGSAWPMASARRAMMPRHWGWFRRCDRYDAGGALLVRPHVCALSPKGWGTAQDLPAARAGFLRAAAEGIGDAAAAAGEMLVNGRGGPSDRPAAMALFHAAAAQGNRAAQYALGVLEPNAPTAAMHDHVRAPAADDAVRTPTGGAHASGGARIAA